MIPIIIITILILIIVIKNDNNHEIVLVLQYTFESPPAWPMPPLLGALQHRPRQLDGRGWGFRGL